MESQRSGSSPDDIMHSQTLQCENDWSQTCPLDFWNRIFRHALLPKRLVIDTKALPGRGPSGSTCSLLSLAPDHSTTEQNCKTNLHKKQTEITFNTVRNSLWYRNHLQDVHAHSRVVVELLHKPTVNDVPGWRKRLKSEIMSWGFSKPEKVNYGATYFIPFMVRDVAAMLVATTHFLIPGGGDWKICFCWSVAAQWHKVALITRRISCVAIIHF